MYANFIFDFHFSLLYLSRVTLGVGCGEALDLLTSMIQKFPR